MSLLVRLALYVPVLFLVMVVYVGQHEETAAATLRGAVRKTIKWTGYTILLVVGMEVVEWLFLPRGI
jgi:hypothetical protein